jgi:DNA-binding MurR/RpiR family transcriptional regulator
MLEYQLSVLGLPVASATSPGEVVHRVSHLGKRDLLVAVSYRRGLRQTVDGLRQARANGAYCIGITDSIVSPLGEFADECFLTSVETPSFHASYAAPIALLNALVVACANYRRSHTSSGLRKLEQEERQGPRWFEN